MISSQIQNKSLHTPLFILTTGFERAHGHQMVECARGDI